MNSIEKSGAIFKSLGDETRLKIVCTLLNEELSVSSIAKKVNMSLSAVSHQLKVLKMNEILKAERKGKEIYYSLNDEHIKVMIDQVLTHVEHLF